MKGKSFGTLEITYIDLFIIKFRLNLFFIVWGKILIRFTVYAPDLYLK